MEPIEQLRNSVKELLDKDKDYLALVEEIDNLIDTVNAISADALSIRSDCFWYLNNIIDNSFEITAHHENVDLIKIVDYIKYVTFTATIAITMFIKYGSRKVKLKDNKENIWLLDDSIEINGYSAGVRIYPADAENISYNYKIVIYPISFQKLLAEHKLYTLLENSYLDAEINVSDWFTSKKETIKIKQFNFDFINSLVNWRE